MWIDIIIGYGGFTGLNDDYIKAFNYFLINSISVWAIILIVRFFIEKTKYPIIYALGVISLLAITPGKLIMGEYGPIHVSNTISGYSNMIACLYLIGVAIVLQVKQKKSQSSLDNSQVTANS